MVNGRGRDGGDDGIVPAFVERPLLQVRVCAAAVAGGRAVMGALCSLNSSERRNDGQPQQVDSGKEGVCRHSLRSCKSVDCYFYKTKLVEVLLDS